MTDRQAKSKILPLLSYRATVNSIRYADSDRKPWFERLRDRLFPWRYCCAPDDPRLTGDFVGISIKSHLSWIDRIRVLLSGRIAVSVKLICEHRAGYTRASSTITVQPPEWME